jgi:hypothetical protein
MLVLSPKEQKKAENIYPEEIAKEFTEKELNLVDQILSEDYKVGFREGISKYIQKNGK